MSVLTTSNDILRTATLVFLAEWASEVDSEEHPAEGYEDSVGEAFEAEEEEEDSVVALAVVLAVIFPTRNCMLITMDLIHQVVPVDLVEAVA